MNIQSIFREIEYSKKLSQSIDELDKYASNPNPFLFAQAFNDFKLFVVMHWSRIDYDLDAKTRILIEDVFNTEQSQTYRLYEFVANNMDYFFRFMYLVVFLLYLFLKLADLY